MRRNDLNFKLLLVEDEKDVRKPLVGFLRKKGYEVFEAENGSIAVELLKTTKFDLVLSDIQMPEMSGLELLHYIKSNMYDIPVIIFTAYGSVEDAVDTIRMGAYDYILKPLIFENIVIKIKTALENLSDVRSEKSKLSPLDSIIGNSASIFELKNQIISISEIFSSVVIHGDSGTGKELVAKSLHLLSKRKNSPFIPVNCAAIPENLMESIFFGHVKGAFTGASENHVGLFEKANGGTIFLDEVAELPLNLQSKLLRVFEDGQIMPVGASSTKTIDVNVIAASATKLKSAVDNGKFRNDLFYRINVIELFVPSLIDRKEDIPLLAQHFLNQFSTRHDHKTPSFSVEAISVLQSHNWPGNVRELRNVVERSAIFCNKPEIQISDLPHEIINKHSHSISDESHKSAIKDYERELILKALRSAKNEKTLAAKMLGISRATLYRKLEDFKIDI